MYMYIYVYIYLHNTCVCVYMYKLYNKYVFSPSGVQIYIDMMIKGVLHKR